MSVCMCGKGMMRMCVHTTAAQKKILLLIEAACMLLAIV